MPLWSLFCGLWYAVMGPLGFCNFKILLLHTSDMHSRFNEVGIHKTRCQDMTSRDCYGGFARIRAAVNQNIEEAKKRGVPTIYLDAGDVFGESVYYKEYKWELAYKMMNLLKPDAMSIGQHEFDDGIVGLAPYIQNLKIPVVCSNIKASKESGLSKIIPSKIFDLNGIKVGVVGYTSPVIPEENIGTKLEISDEIESLNAEAKRLKTVDKVKVVIALGHAGYYRDIEIAQNSDNIDVIVGGRSHFFLYPKDLTPPSSEKPEGPYPTIVKKGEKNIPILHASSATKYLGRIELEFDQAGNVLGYTGHPILLKGEMEQDESIKKALEPYKKEIQKKYQTVIGETQVMLEGKSCLCRFQECNIGNLVTDAFVEVINKKYKTFDGQQVAQIGLMQSPDINANLNPKSEHYTGEIVKEDVVVILPFNRHLEVLKVKGKDLRAVLESALNTYNPKKGGLVRACLLQVSGLQLQYDMTKKQGERLTGVKVAGGQDLDDDTDYNVVMTDFLAKGGDGIQCNFLQLKDKPRVIKLGEDAVDYLVVSEYIATHTPLTEEAYQLQNRININEPQKIRKDPK